MPRDANQPIWSLEIVRQPRDGASVFTVTGRLGTAASAIFLKTFKQAVLEGQRRLVIDLSGVDYISGAGLRAFDAVADRAASRGGKLVLCGMTEPVRLAFDLAGRLQRYVCEPTVEEGVALVARRPK